MNNNEPQDDEEKSECPFPIQVIDVEIGEPDIFIPVLVDWSKITY